MPMTLIEAREDDSLYRTGDGDVVVISDAGPDLDLNSLWSEFTQARALVTGLPRPWGTPQGTFREYLRLMGSDEAIVFCGCCELPEWQTDFTATGRMTLDEQRVCADCIDSTYYFCEECGGWYHEDDSGEHDHGDDYDGCCASPQLTFAIRNGCEPLANDTRVTVTLPEGQISDEGIGEIRAYLYGKAREAHRAADRATEQGLWSLADSLEDLGSEWQTRNGNYPKRLSGRAYKNYSLKLAPEILSKAGCIARDHSKSADFAVEVTRDLNQDAAAFYHGGSCWFDDSYGYSRCTLKTNGGFGLRAFSSYGISGRAWVMPLRLDEDGRLTPTFETMAPDAFVIFNGYGDLQGYTAPRIMAHLADWTYRKIDFDCSPMYINSGGYLVAPEEITQKISRIDLRVDQHSDLYEMEKAKAKELASVS